MVNQQLKLYKIQIFNSQKSCKKYSMTQSYTKEWYKTQPTVVLFVILFLIC
jgi:hypothetical protein